MMENNIKQLEPDRPIYQLVVEHLDDNGMLAGNFCLSRYACGGPPGWADGAMDGVAIYHMTPTGEVNIAALSEVLQTAITGNFGLANAKLSQCRIDPLALTEPLWNWILTNQDQLDANMLQAYASELLSQSIHMDMIKFALIVLAVIQVPEETRTMIRQLAACDEFTLFSLFCVQQWPDANREIFDIACKTRGWGRIHAVYLLQPEEPEIKKWFLTDGVDNLILPEYSALVCAQKGDLFKRLGSTGLSLEEFRGAGKIIAGLLSEDAISGISEIKYPVDILNRYINQAEQFGMANRNKETIGKIVTWLKTPDSPQKTALLDRCKRLLQ